MVASRPLDSGSQKVQHRFGGFKHNIYLTSITSQVPATKHAAIDRAPGARSKSVEFSVGT